MRIHVAILICLPFISTCTRYPRVHLDPPVQSTHMQESLSSLVSQKEHLFTGGTFENNRWWTFFHDEKLNCLIEKALLENPSLQSVFDKVQASEQQAIVVRSQLFPTVENDVDYKYWSISKVGLFRSQSPDFTALAKIWTFNLDLTYEIDIWHRNTMAYRAALGEAAAMCAMYFEARLLLSVAIAQSYFDIKILSMIQNELEALAFDIAWKEQLEAQKSIMVDDLRPELNAQSEYELIQSEVVKNRNNIEIAKAALKVLLGEDQDAKIEIQETLCPMDKEMKLPKDLNCSLLYMRPDLVAQMCRVQAAALKVGVAQTAFYPSFNLDALGGLESIFTGKFLSVEALTGFLLPAFITPIFTGWRLTGELRKKVAEYEQSAKEYEDMILRASGKVVESVVALQSIFEQKELHKKNYFLKQEVARLTNLRFTHGIDSKIMDLDAKIQAERAKIAWISLVGMDFYARLVLIKELGGGYSCGE